ncbi:hypothetical protein X777_15183 [Ooceraea biroi]|uniref:Uncharacterized protein n=1 Tax=Ooceraea biroi TaxID=2015173 RepID=A0A026VYC1_OOCBI|nr:hypothetical protein X777_15183 [Ooceraea biroi]
MTFLKNKYFNAYNYLGTKSQATVSPYNRRRMDFHDMSLHNSMRTKTDGLSLFSRFSCTR